MKEVLHIKDPRFPDFLERLEDYIEQARNGIIKKANKQKKFPPGELINLPDGQRFFLVYVPQEDRNRLVRKALEETGELIEVDGTIKYFKSLDGLCNCDDCKAMLDLIRTYEGNA